MHRRDAFSSMGSAGVLVACLLVGTAHAQTAPAPAEAQGPPASAPATQPQAASDAPPAKPKSNGKDHERPVKITAKVGKGFTFSVGDYFSLGIRGRVMLRYTGATENGKTAHEFAVRRARLYLAGHVLSPNLQYYFHVAFAPRDFDPSSVSPLYDAYLQLTYLRDFHLRIGQQLVPFNRSRVISSQNAELVDRSIVNAELNLDRDVGVKFYSEDVGGLGHKFGYEAFIGSGEGRNQLAGDYGLLYLGRLKFNPMGKFEDYSEGDLDRNSTPKLSIGIAAGYNQRSVRQRGTTGDRFKVGQFDTIHGNIDLIFKYRGFSLLAEGIIRQARQQSASRTEPDGTVVTSYSRSAVGYFVQAGVILPKNFGLAARWSRLYALGPNDPNVPRTDPELIKTVSQHGKEIAASFSYYLYGHVVKFQADYSYLFGDANQGLHQVRAQIHLGY